MRRNQIAFMLAGAALTAIALAGCSGSSGSVSSSGGSTGSSSSSGSSTSSSSGSSTNDGDMLSTASSSIGNIVVDSNGKTVYVFGMDKKGETAAACTGSCAGVWPAVTTSGSPMVSGVSGTIGTISGPNGTKQVTLNGLPLYTYSGDSSKGDVNGQLLQNAWWAVGPDGSKITTAASSSSSGGGLGY